MNHHQISKKNMYDKVRKFLMDNGAVWVLFIPLVDGVAAFLAQLIALEEFIKKQEQTISGITADKDKKRVAMGKIIVKYGRKAKAWAKAAGDATLEAVFDVHLDDFVNGTETAAIGKAEDVRDALNTNIGSLAAYNVLPANVTAITNAIKDFKDAKPNPGAAEAAKKTSTEAINLMMHDVDETLDTVDDLLINEYEETDETLVLEYRANRVLVTVGMHHTRIEAHVIYGDKTDAEGIKMKVVELDRSSVSDIEGMTESKNLKPGTYHVEFSGANIVTKVIVVKVPRGVTVHLAVEVVKI